MELTIDQVLQRGIASHKAGNIQEAQQFYRTILRSQPMHPDANHNLGVLVASSNNLGDALPLFKSALDANPRIEQFWISYIDALIKEHKFKTAKRALQKARKAKFTGNKFNALQVQLTSTIKAQAKMHPSQAEIDSMLMNYQNGQHDKAKDLARSIIKKCPEHALSWKVLGGVLGQSGHLSEALIANQNVVRFNAKDAEAYNNLGVTLKKLGRLEEAVTSYMQAIELRPGFAQAFNNLGNTLQQLGRLDEAEKNFRQAIGLKPDYVGAHSNLGNTLQQIGRLDEAEESCREAIALNADFFSGHNHLGNTLQEAGRLKEAEESYLQAIELKAGYAEALLNLSIVQDYMNKVDEAIRQLEYILTIDLGNFGLKAAINFAIFKFLAGDFSISKENLLASSRIQELSDFEFKNYIVYRNYLLKIINWHENKPPNSNNFVNSKTLYVIGESHTLTSHGLQVKTSKDHFLCTSILIQGCMQWLLGNAFKNKYKFKIEGVFHSIPKSSDVLLAIGEIDCRLDSGIIKHKNKFPEKKIADIIEATVERYLNYIHKLNATCGHKITIQGVPCPNVDIIDVPEERVLELILLNKDFNICLKKKSIENEFNFLDVYTLTDRGDGFSNSIWHIDDTHITPAAMVEAWRLHLFTS